MRRKTIEGVCKICGKRATLTFEHVPPQAAFNDFKYAELQAEEVIKLVSEDNRMPWDTSGLKKVYKQGGTGGYFLCRACNNNFGIWYVKEYVKFVYTLHNILLENDIRKLNQLTLEIQQLKPLRIFKSILAMFCAINNDCFGDNELREFLINKRAVNFNKSRYRIFAYLWSGGFQRRNGLSGIITNNGKQQLFQKYRVIQLGLFYL